MKKIMMFFLILISLFNIKNVFAQDQYELTLEKQNGIYMTRRGVSYGYDSYPFYIYKMNGMFAYCIEPGKHITTYTYVGTSDYIDLPFSEELKEKLELIGYYGRDYPGHDHVRYSMAAQALIWELTGVDEVTFWTKQNEGGEEIDVTKERNEIMSLVNSHKTLPSFKSSYSADLNKEITITDTNKVLNNYEIVSKGINDTYIENNTLHITPKAIGNFDINFKRTSYDEYNTIIFVGKSDNSSQKLGRLHFNKEIKTKITVNVNGISLIVQKVDENNQPIKFSGIKFKIKNITNNNYVCNDNSCVYSTNMDGKFTISGLSYGEYEIEEVENQIIKGYSWNSEKYHVSLNQNTNIQYNDIDHNYVDIKFKNNSVLGTLEIYKKAEKAVFNNNEIKYNEINFANVFFDLYTIDNKLVKTVATGPGGYAQIDNLRIGKYYLVEKYKLNDYLDLDKIYFEIKQDNQYQSSINYKLNIKNVLKKGRLEFSKIDFITKKGINKTIIEIYNNKDKLLLTRETNDDGMVIIDNLPLGKYYIKEKEANYYYEKTDEVINFEIKENNEVVKKNMTNKKLLGKIELEKMGEEFTVLNNEINYQPRLLANIEFNLYSENGKLLDTLKTNENGYLSKELELGKYYLQEKSTLPNYLENNEKYYFEIKKENNKVIDVKLHINNYLKKGGVEFSKEEFITFLGIADTIMELYNDRDELLLTRKTNHDGKIIITDLPLGKYYFKEREANYYFQVTDEIVPFEIKNAGELIKTKLPNKKIVGNLEIYKVGENYHFINNDIVYEKGSLHGIEFELYDINNNLIDTIETDNNGYAKYSDLPLGKYYLQEKTILDRYNQDNSKYYFEIKKNGNKALDAKIEIVNYYKKGNVEFSKIDSITNEGIPNTIIEIYNDKNILLMTKETDSNGKIIINNMPYGKYYVKELKANYNYEKTTEKVFFEISDNQKTIKVQMTNKRITGNLEIDKNGEEYEIINEKINYKKNKLANIEFDLFDIEGKLIATLKTDENGHTSYSNLPLGKYYLEEKTKLFGYIDNNEKYYFEIKKDNNKALDVKLNIDNYLKKGILEFSKIDFVTSEGIPNTIVEIYDEYNNLWFTKKTDENGKIVVNDLPIGKYYIIEKEANSMYMITNEKVFFEIKENGEIAKAVMTNEKIEVPVPKTNTNEGIIANVMLSISFVIGIGKILYERKKSY